MEAPEAHHRLMMPNTGSDVAFAQSIDNLAHRGLEPMPHPVEYEEAVCLDQMNWERARFVVQKTGPIIEEERSNSS